MRLFGDALTDGMLADLALADKHKIPFRTMTRATMEAFVHYEHQRAGIPLRPRKT